jgi:serine phosphatase RsbU (regulator of sigma subunit)
MKNILKRAWVTLSIFGTQHITDYEVKKKIKLSNQVNTVLVFTGLIYSNLFLFYDQTHLGSIGFVIVFFLLLGTYFSIRGKFILSRLIMIGVTNVAVVLYAYLMGFNSGIHTFFFALVSLPWVIFRKEEKFYLVFSVSLSFLFWFAFSCTHQYVQTSVDLAPQIALLFYFLTGVMTFLILLSGMLFNFQNNEFFKIKSQIAIRRLRTKYEDLKQKHQIDKELLMAKDIQLKMLPSKPPEVPGYAVTQFYQAACVVGGDFLDYIPLSETRVAVLIADIVGKGIPASLMTQALKTALDTALKDVAVIQSPAVVMDELNRMFDGHSTIQRHVPMVFGVLDSAANTFVYSNAGHEPGIVLRADGSFKELTVGGSPLGMNFAIDPEDIDAYEEEVLDLSVGDKVILFTDGFTDIKSDTDERFDNEQFNKVLCDNRTLRGQAYVDRVVEVCNAFQNVANQADDMTLIVLERYTTTGKS